jgi:hypothetical protein
MPTGTSKPCFAYGHFQNDLKHLQLSPIKILTKKNPLHSLKEAALGNESEMKFSFK